MYNKYGWWNEFVQSYCTVQSTGWGLYGAVLVVQSDSSRKEGPAIPLLHTLRVYQSVAEGAAQCCESDLQGVGLQQRWQLVHHPALSYHLHWVKRASQGGAGLLDKFIKSPPVCCWDAAAPADYSIENGWCHHRVIERVQECPLHSKGTELLNLEESKVNESCKGHHNNLFMLHHSIWGSDNWIPWR